MNELVDIVKSFEDQTVLSHFSAIIEEGKITCIYEPSRSSNTTLLNIIGLIEKPDEGITNIDGETEKKLFKTLKWFCVSTLWFIRR